MKNLRFLLLLATATGYTYLFYHQLTGINYLVFDLLIVLFTFLLDANRFRKLPLVVVSTALLASAGFVFFHNTIGAIFFNWVSFVLFARLYYAPELSLYLAFPEQLFATFVSFFDISKWRELNGQGNGGKNIGMYLLLLPVVGVFLYLYALGNANYSNILGNLFDFEFNLSVVPFFLSGLVIAFCVFAPTYYSSATIFDASCNNQLINSGVNNEKSSLFTTLLKEYQGGMFLLIMLNLITLSFHATDLYYFFVPKTTSLVQNYSANVHQGVNSLIASIILAIVIVLYFFRGQLNFIAEKKALKTLTYIWMVQNLALVYSTALRNFVYIDKHGLTHKRIGVYVWLLLVLIGIVWTVLKVNQTKSTWYLLRVNTWTVFIVMLAYISINWDREIVKHNLSHRGKDIDYAYLGTLSTSAIGEINASAEQDPTIENLKPTWAYAIRLAREDMAVYKKLGWQSFNLDSEQIEQSFQK